MSPTKDSKVRSVRIKNEVDDEINRRIKRRGITVNSWLSWAVTLGLRKHGKTLEALPETPQST